MQAKRFLCVEDDADTRDMPKTRLRLSDFETVVASDMDAALHLMERVHEVSLRTTLFIFV
jgi:DNA-binding response OmpR family regulator